MCLGVAGRTLHDMKEWALIFLTLKMSFIATITRLSAFSIKKNLVASLSYELLLSG